MSVLIKDRGWGTEGTQDRRHYVTTYGGFTDKGRVERPTLSRSTRGEKT